MEDGEMKEDLKEYRRMKMMGKKMVQEAKKRVNKEWTVSTTENYKENKKYS